MRRELQRELRRLQRETGLATVIVTHDPEEAAFLAQEVIVISDGRALQSGSNRQVFTRPRSPEIARLLGISNLHRALITDSGFGGSGGTNLEVGQHDFTRGTAVLWTILPERIDVRSSGVSRDDDPMVIDVAGTLVDVADIGTAVDLYVRLDDDLELHARAVDPVILKVGDQCVVTMRRSDIDVWIDSSVREDIPSESGHASA